MYVVMHDWHLNDETVGKRNIPVGFFEDFFKNIKDKAEIVKAERIVLVFGGDFLDLLSSALWNYKIKNGNYHYDLSAVKPWSEDRHLIFLKAKEILNNIFNTLKVKEILKLFQSFSSEISLPVQVYYLIGNHDRLLSIFPELRKETAEAFGKKEGEDFFFDQYLYDEKIGLYVAHGNENDISNFEPDIQDSPLGDAIVIELLNRLPIEMLRKTSSLFCFRKLAEIEEVRPRKATLAFGKMVLKKEGVRPKVLGEVVRHLGGEFFSNEFVEDWLSTHFWLLSNYRTGLRYSLLIPVLKILRFLRLSQEDPEFYSTLIKLLTTFSIPLKMFEQGNSSHKRKISSVSFRRKWKNAEYVVLGHFHDFEESLVSSNQKTYHFINPSTWQAQYYWLEKRKKFEKQRRITYVIFFEEGEQTSLKCLRESKMTSEEVFGKENVI